MTSQTDVVNEIVEGLGVECVLTWEVARQHIAQAFRERGIEDRSNGAYYTRELIKRHCKKHRLAVPGFLGRKRRSFAGAALMKQLVIEVERRPFSPGEMGRCNRDRRRWLGRWVRGKLEEGGMKRRKNVGGYVKKLWVAWCKGRKRVKRVMLTQRKLLGNKTLLVHLVGIVCPDGCGCGCGCVVMLCRNDIWVWLKVTLSLRFQLWIK